MNLVINAVEAMEGRSGSVQITTVLRTFARHQTMESTFVVRPQRPGNYVCLEVRDGGRGMDSGTLDRIFDPFFSTKESGHGLGLSTMLGIIRSLNGALQVQSTPAWGTLFRVFLPASEIAHSAGAPLGPLTSGSPEEGCVILVIDDEPAVREAAQDILLLAGHTVLSAATGAEGLALFQAQQETISLVLVDMKMPGMNGLEVMAEIWRLAPQTLVILSTGYSEHMLDEAALSRQPAGFLHKPYDGRTLVSAVERVLQPNRTSVSS